MVPYKTCSPIDQIAPGAQVDRATNGPLISKEQGLLPVTHSVTGRASERIAASGPPMIGRAELDDWQAEPGRPSR